MWKLDVVLHDVGYLLLYRGCIDALHKLGCDGDTAFAATMHDTPFAPFWTHLCHLAQRHSGTGVGGSRSTYRGVACRSHCRGCGYTQILNITISHVALVAHHDGQFVITLPDVSHLQVAGGGIEGELCGGTGDAQLRRDHRVKRDVDDGIRLQIVSVYPLQFGHPAHPFHQSLGSYMQ